MADRNVDQRKPSSRMPACQISPKPFAPMVGSPPEEPLDNARPEDAGKFVSGKALAAGIAGAKSTRWDRWLAPFRSRLQPEVLALTKHQPTTDCHTHHASGGLIRPYPPSAFFDIPASFFSIQFLLEFLDQLIASTDHQADQRHCGNVSGRHHQGHVPTVHASHRPASCGLIIVVVRFILSWGMGLGEGNSRVAAITHGGVECSK